MTGWLSTPPGGGSMLITRARRDGEPAGHAAGTVRRGESEGAGRDRNDAVHRSHWLQGFSRADDDAAIRGAQLRHDNTQPAEADLQRLSEPVRPQHEIQPRRPDTSLAIEGTVPEPRGT